MIKCLLFFDYAWFLTILNYKYEQLLKYSAPLAFALNFNLIEILFIQQKKKTHCDCVWLILLQRASIVVMCVWKSYKNTYPFGSYFTFSKRTSRQFCIILRYFITVHLWESLPLFPSVISRNASNLIKNHINENILSSCRYCIIKINGN